MSIFSQIFLCSVNPESLHNCLHKDHLQPVALMPLPTAAFHFGFQTGLKMNNHYKSSFNYRIIQFQLIIIFSALIHPGVLHELVPSLLEYKLVELTMGVLLQLLNHLVRN
ncbi:Hypothetical_protein [Hexamita inflata]|uniref:Hypothetical_protein n=1 Tax=Hexamita inflata TaxID=28002 RepID=A0AA86Q857_9EUKA|nr:Hypothetical protein HINF_LOCUS35617 [Hexamita inflata]